ncbi:Galactose-1-phosphate uridylyltransferase [Grifola frondosa]|uniref:Galactose-1-phosphate uridylyltransferase n=1 Tax=Grifola frondosa TaxID=5627 RepID=A0A1C7MEH0_GRIFR|nr:Galactose-1-phosphate uridylyltransferase [Grifola frondosa]
MADSAEIQFDPTNHPHRRRNPLTDEYVLVSPHRNRRPWLGQTEPPQPSNLPEYDPQCYLCPGNARAGGHKNDIYAHTMIFENDYAAVLPPPAPVAPLPLIRSSLPSLCKEAATLPISDIERIIDDWCTIYRDRGAQDAVNYVQIFENKGAMMGCSNPHPHGQVWSLSEIPSIPAKELANLKRYSLTDVSSSAPRGPHNRPCMLCEYAHFEAGVPYADGRTVSQNEHWIAVVPWWAVWPFEVLRTPHSLSPQCQPCPNQRPAVLPYKRHIPSIAHLTPAEKLAFAHILSSITIRYDNLFSCSFAYSMGIHQRPVPPSPSSAPTPEDEDDENVAHLHLHFAPPLLRSANVRKFLVGFE